MNLLTVFHQGDAILITVFLLLAGMSVMTWYLIVVRFFFHWRSQHANKATETTLWAANDWQRAEHAIAENRSSYANLTRAGLAALRHYQANKERSLGEACNVNDFLTRAIRKSLSQETGKQESGMTMLASVGSTAPFIGLFGTVWGIYHALVNIGQQGQVSIGTVAGPIGEALVATAAGLAAAIPAVLAYNALTRMQRVMSQDMDYFAHDLHAQLLTQAGEIHGVR